MTDRTLFAYLDITRPIVAWEVAIGRVQSASPSVQQLHPLQLEPDRRLGPLADPHPSRQSFGGVVQIRQVVDARLVAPEVGKFRTSSAQSLHEPKSACLVESLEFVHAAPNS